MNNIKIKYNIKPEQSLWEAQNEAELCIITADFALEYPQPLLPGALVYVNFYNLVLNWCRHNNNNYYNNFFY